MFVSKAAAALLKLKEIDRKYRIKPDSEKQHSSLSISEVSSIEQRGEISQSHEIPGSGDRPDSSARIKLNIQMPDTRMEPNDVARSSLAYQPEVFKILKETEQNSEENSSRRSEITEDRTVGPAGEGSTSDTFELITSRGDSQSQNHKVDRDASIGESATESLGQISSRYSEVSQQQVSAKSRSSIPTEVGIPPTAVPSDCGTSYSEDFANSGSSAVAESLETENKSTNSKTSPKGGSNQESPEESPVGPPSPDPSSSQRPNGVEALAVDELNKSPLPRIEATLEDIHSPKWVSKSPQASSDSSSKLRSSRPTSGSKDDCSRLRDSLSDFEDERHTDVAIASDSQCRRSRKHKSKSNRRASTTGEIALAQSSELVTEIGGPKTYYVEKSIVTSEREHHPELLASYSQDEIVGLVLGRLKAEVTAAQARRKTASKRVSKSVKKRTRHNACLIGTLQSSANNNYQIYLASGTQPLPAITADPPTREKVRAKSSDSSLQKRRLSRAKNDKTTCSKANRIQRQKSFAKRNKETIRLRNESQDSERRWVRGLRDQREQERLSSSVREHVRRLIEEQEKVSVRPEIPVTFARHDDFWSGAPRERRCFKPLDLPNVAAFDRSELEDEVVDPHSRSLAAIRQRVLEIRHRLKDQFALYRDYSDLVSVLNAKYKPVTLKDTKKIIRDMRRSSNNDRRRRVAARDDHVYCQ